MSGGILISQFILLPVLVILGWIYVRLRPRCGESRGMVKFDAVVLSIAVLASAAGVVWAAGTDIGSDARIWKPILSIITTFHIFPIVLFLGWWFRRRIFADRTSDEDAV